MTLAFRWLERSITTLRKLRHRLPPPSPRSAAPVKTHKQVRSEPNMRVARHKSTSVVEGRRRHDASPTSTLRRAASNKISLQLGTQGVSSTSLLSGIQRQKSKHRPTVLPPVTQATSPQQLSPQSTAATPTQSRSSTPGPDHHLHSTPSMSPNHTHSPGNQTPQSQTPQSRPRSRFSFQSLKNWRPKRWGSSSVSSTASPSPVETPSYTSFPSPYPASSSRVAPVRSVPDGMNHQRQHPTEFSWRDQDPFHDNRVLNAGLRASSWGDFNNYPHGTGDVYSLHSGNVTDNEEFSGSVQRVRPGITYVNSGSNWLMNSCSSVGTSRTSSGGELQNVFSSLTMSPNPRRVVEPPPSNRHTQEPSAGRPHTTSPLNQTHRYADTYDSDESSVFDRGYCGPDSRPGPSRVYSGEDEGDDDDDGADSDTSHHLEIARRKSTATPRTQNRREPEPSEE